MKCLHMSGAGNDFMVVDARGKDYDFEAMAIELCVRGLLLLARQIRSKYLHPAIKEATE